MLCTQCEDMLADALDGTLSAADQATFDLHMLGCPACSEMLANARSGADWLETLHAPRPEPSATLLERIIAQTSGKDAALANPPIVLGSNDRLRTRPPNTILGQPIPVRPSITQPSFASANVLPFCDSSSTASSRLVESVPPCVNTGLHSTGSVESRAVMRARFPHTVLISPL